MEKAEVPSLEEFRRFALLSGGILTFLSIARPTGSLAYARASVMSFADLPEVYSVIRGCMPVLKTLRLNLRGLDSAEDTCLPLLSASTLERRGSLERFEVIEPFQEPQHYQVVQQDGCTLNLQQMPLRHITDPSHNSRHDRGALLQ